MSLKVNVTMFKPGTQAARILQNTGWAGPVQNQAWGTIARGTGG